MGNFKKIILGFFVFATISYAGGAASIVAQKSKTKNFSYSLETRLFFMDDCARGANEYICRCVLNKLQQNYSETTYLKLDADLRKKIEHSDFINFLSDAAEKCDSEYAGGRRDNRFNNGYAEGGSNGIGDGLAVMLGGGGGGIATKAKGSIKTPSMRDVEFVSGGEYRSAADIMKVIRQRTPSLRHIFNKSLKEKPGFQGKVTLKFTIASNGEIISISIVSSTTGFGEFDREIKSAVSRWTFSKVKEGNTTVMIPFDFSE